MFQNSGFGNSFDGGFSEGGFTKDDSAGPSGDKQKKSRYVNLVPITASSLAEMTPGDSSFTYLGTEISQVTVVGSIFSQKKNDMCNTYQLDDTFGLLTLKHWSSGEEELDTSEHQDLEVGKYVRVYGQLRCFQNEVVVNVLHIRLVKDINEINTHLLEFMKYKQHVSSKVKKTKPVNGIPSFAGDGNNTTAYGNFGLSNVQTQVLQVVEKSTAPEGINVDEVLETLASYNPKQLKESLNFLIDEGYIYTTINEKHYRAT